MAVDDLNAAGLRALPDDSPVTMPNLVKFRERAADGNGSGWEAYLRYSKATMPMIKARGGTMLWSGKADAVVLVRYPSRAAFLDMLGSAAYQTQANPHRISGTEAHLIVATTESYSKFSAA